MLDDRFLDVDRHGVLRVPMHLWIGLTYLARHWLILLLALASARRSPEALSFAAESLSWLALFLEIPSVLLLMAGLLRHPKSWKFWSFIWKKGVAIIGLTMAANSGFFMWWLWQTDYWSRWPELFLASCLLLDVAIFSGAYRSAYIRQVFREFPSKELVKDASQ